MTDQTIEQHWLDHRPAKVRSCLCRDILYAVLAGSHSCHAMTALSVTAQSDRTSTRFYLQRALDPDICVEDHYALR